jgi:hypothetical protein
VLRGGGVGGVGSGHDGGDDGGVPGCGGGCEPGDPVAAGELVGQEQHRAPDEDHEQAQGDAEQSGIEDCGEVDGQAEGEPEERDHRRDEGGQQGPHALVQVADQHAECEREDGADQCLPGERGQACDPEGDHGQEGAGFEGEDRVGSGVALAAELSHEGHVEAAVGVVQGGDEGEGREACEDPGADGGLVQEVAGEEADEDGEADLGAQERPALLEHVGGGPDLEG